MTWLKFLFASACAALLGVGIAAQPREKDKDPIAVIAERMYFGDEFALTLTAADTGEKFERTREATVWDHLAFRNCFSKDGKGALTAVVRFTKTGKEYTLRTTGPADDLYLVHILDLQKPFAKWQKAALAAVKDSPDVTVGECEVPRGAKSVDPVPGFLLGAVAAAAVKYEEKRAELFLRVRKRSHLFFPPAAKAQWSVYRDGDRLYVTTGCVDKMYHATFRVEFKKKRGGGEAEWEYVGLRGQEAWKGE
jgi:hypothetical protein